MKPETNYAKSGDVYIAYQVNGTGSFDLVWAPGTFSHLDMDWEFPMRADFFLKLGTICRLIRFDSAGQVCPTARRRWRRLRNEPTIFALSWTRLA